ncbi:MAG: hypothetical protein ABI554_12665 [Flavobacterium sp.]
MEKVIFDTNAYRYLVTNKTNKGIDALIKKVNHREKQNGIESLLNPIVAKELLAHIANKKDSSYLKCLKAIKALYYHSGNNSDYSMIPTPELLISKSFFNKIINRRVETNKAFGQMVYHFAKKPNKYVETKFQHKLNLNAKDVKDVEQGFAEEMENFLAVIDPNRNGWNVFENDPIGRKKALEGVRKEETSIAIALGYLFITRGLLVEEGQLEAKSQDELMIELLPMAKEFIKIFPEPIALQKSVFENMITSDFNLFEKNRSNFIWDIQMMFYVGQNSVQNSKIIFVTSDKAMIKSALGTNPNNTILNFDEYMEYLGLK